MESHRLVLRHIIGVEATKERKRLRQVVRIVCYIDVLSKQLAHTYIGIVFIYYMFF